MSLPFRHIDRYEKCHEKRSFHGEAPKIGRSPGRGSVAPILDGPGDVPPNPDQSTEKCLSRQRRRFADRRPQHKRAEGEVAANVGPR